MGAAAVLVGSFEELSDRLEQLRLGIRFGDECLELLERDRAVLVAREHVADHAERLPALAVARAEQRLEIAVGAHLVGELLARELAVTILVGRLEETSRRVGSHQRWRRKSRLGGRGGVRLGVRLGGRLGGGLGGGLSGGLGGGLDSGLDNGLLRA